MRISSKACFSKIAFLAIFFVISYSASAGVNISNSPWWWSTCPRITLGPDGSAHVIWVEEYGETNGDVYYAKYDANSQQWSSPLNLSNSSQVYSKENRAAGIDSDPSGNIYVSYFENINKKIKLRICTNGSWGSPIDVATTLGDCDSARVAVDSSGNIVLTWWDMSRFVCYSRARIDGNWENVKAISAGSSKFPDIAVGNGVVFACWAARNSQGVYDIYYARRNKTFNAAWSSPQLVNPLPPGVIKQQAPAVEIDSNDIAHVVWTPVVVAGGTRQVRYAYWTGSGFSAAQNISVPKLLHYPALHERGNNIYCTWQVGGYEDGSSINYNSRVSGAWEGEKTIPSSSGSTYCDVAASYYQDKIYYVWDASGDIYIDTVTGPGSLPPGDTALIISGTVRTSTGSALSGVTISGLPSNPVTSVSGAYSDTVDPGWSGVVTPVRTGYTFGPSSRSYTTLMANQLTQDYTAGTGGCVYTSSPTIHFFLKAGGTGSISVTSSGGCAWSAVSNDSWIVITSGSSGSGNGTVQFTVSSNVGSPSRTGTMIVAGQTVTVQQEGELDFNASFGYIILPECIWAPATGGGTWLSEVQVTDLTGGSMVSVYFSYGGGMRRGPITIWNNSGGEKRSAKFSNFLSFLGLIDAGFSYYGRVGAVEFLTQDADHHIQVMARTLSGNCSKTFPGLIPAEENAAIVGRPMMIQNFTNNATYRSTCGFFNPTTSGLTVDFRLYDGNGGLIGSAFTKSFVGYDFKSFNPFNEAGRPYPSYAYDNAFLAVTPTSGTGGLICFGASANNYSNDPAAHVALQYQGSYDNSPAGYIVLPECIWALATGGGTWLSEVQITDLTGGSEVSAYFAYGGGLRRGPIPVWTNSAGAGRSRMLYNFLSYLGSIDTDFSYYGRVGPVEFVTQDENHKIQVAARTRNGNFSKTFPGLRPADSNTADTSREMIIQNCTSNVTYRSAGGFFNPTSDSVTVVFQLYNKDGATLGSAFTKTFTGYNLNAFDPFSEAGIPYPGSSNDNVILVVRPTSGLGKIICFGASANNTSNDPAAHIALQYR